jgi:tetratricopeptide (TPR) repeat protein
MGEHEGEGMDDTELARLHQAVQADPADTAARLALLHGLVAVRRWHEAEQVGSSLLQAEDAPAAVHTCMGVVYGKQGRWDEAVQQCRQALALHPDDSLALFNLGSLLARQDDTKAALEYLEKAVEHASEWAEAHYTLGTVLLRQERYQEAIRAFDRALECRTVYPEAHFNRGNAHALRGLEANGALDYYELDCAINAYKTAIQQHPGYAAALYNLGMVYQRMGSAEGLRVWNQYIEAAQDLPDEELWRLRAQEYTRDLQDRLR